MRFSAFHPFPATADRSRWRRAAAAFGVIGAGAALAAVATAAPATANPAGPHDPIGAVHFGTGSSTAVQATGWAADPDDPTSNATIVSLVDGHIVGKALTSLPNATATSKHGLGPTPGFAVSVPIPDGSVHSVCIAARNDGAGMATVLGCTMTPSGTAVGSGHSPVGAVQSATASATTMTVSGWTRDPDFNARRSVVVLYVDGSSAATVNTTKASASQRAAGASPRGAFSITVPVSSGSHLGCVWVVNIGFGANSSLGCSAVDTRGTAPSTPLGTVPPANRTAAREALSHIGQAYVWGAAGPRVFDCSGLVLYSYSKAGINLPHYSAAQFSQARLIPASRAVRGDLVFYHDSTGSVYHVGIYLSPGLSVAAIDPAEGVNYQHIYDPTATYGSLTHD